MTQQQTLFQKAKDYFAHEDWRLTHQSHGKDSQFVLERADGDPNEVICALSMVILWGEWEDLLRDNVGQWAMLERLKKFARSKDPKIRDSLWTFIETGPGGMDPKLWRKVTEAYDKVGLDSDWMESKARFPQVSVKFALKMSPATGIWPCVTS